MEDKYSQIAAIVRLLRIGRSISQVDLAKRVNKSRAEIDSIETGQLMPSAEFIADISKALTLSSNEIELLRNAFQSISSGNFQTDYSSKASTFQIQNDLVSTSVRHPTVEVQLGLEDLKNAVQEMSERLIKQQQSTSPKDISKLSDELERLKVNIFQLQSASESITAPVILPSRANMEVKLVSSASLDRLEEYRSDENLGYLLVGSFVGAILGSLSNWADDNFVITRSSIILVIIFAVCAIISGIWVIRIHRRASVIKNQFFS